MTKIQLILSNGDFSSHQKNIPMHNNSPNIYHSQPQKATPFFKFRNVGMPLFLPSYNIYQQTRDGHRKNHSEKNIKNIYKFILPPDMHLKLSTEKQNCESFSGAPQVTHIKDNTISSLKSSEFHVKFITYMNN